MRILLLALVLCTAAAAQGTFIPIGQSPAGAGLDGAVTSVVAAPGGGFYVAGDFRWAGVAPAERVARWDENAWHALPGLALTPGSSYLKLTTLADGSLVAGGDISTAGGSSAGGVARWDGSTWSPLGNLIGSVGDRVWDLHVDGGGNLHAAGRFTRDGEAMTVARWTGADWEPATGPLAGIAQALAIRPNGGLAAGGLLRLEGGVSEYQVVVWDGAAWNALPGPVDGSDRVIRSLDWLPDGRLLLSGRFSAVGGVTAGGLAEWDGAAWHPVGTSGLVPAGSIGEVRQDSNGHLLAVGRFTDGTSPPVWALARWDGTEWMLLGDPIDTSVLHLDRDEVGRVMVGGDFSAVGALASPHAAVRADGAWQGVGSSVDGTAIAVAMGTDGSVFVGGEFGAVPDLVTGPVARWDGTAWSSLGQIGGRVDALSAGPDGDVLVLGRLTDIDDAAAAAARWDGSAWTPLGPYGTGTDFHAYSAAILPSGVALRGGRYFGPVQAGVQQWSGDAWVPLGESPLEGNVWAMTVAPNGRLYAAGEMLWTDGEPLPSCVARWTGSEWRAVGDNLRSASNFGDCAWALAFGPDGALYAGGYFHVGDDPARHGVARWDGNTWTALPSSFPEPGVWALRFGPDGRLYAGRLFTPTFTVWNGSDWEVLSASGAVYALAEDAAGRLLLAGNFQEMGGVVSPNVIGYDPPSVASEPPPSVASFDVYPNPTRGAATIRTAVGGRAEVLDALGRVLWSGDVAPGTTDLPTASLAPGVYVVRLVAGDATTSHRLVVGR